ncbi:unnamed protein product [Tilletia controversa]|nr:unnamed protein product [Tilletia controversa]
MHHGTASAISGASAGLAASIVTCPLDVVKTRLQAQIGPFPFRPPPQQQPGGVHAVVRDAVEASAQAQAQGRGVGPGVSAGVGGGAAARSVPNPSAIRTPHVQYQSIPQFMRKIWVEDGFKGFYRGLGPTIFGYLPTWAIYFSVYDTCKDTLASTLHLNYGHSEFVNHIVAAMAAGAASTVCTSPLWVVKTRFMLQSSTDANGKRYRHTGDAFVQIWRTEGWRGFYKGLLPSLFGVSHVAVQFPLYEQFKVWARASRRRTLEEERGIISSGSGSGSGWRGGGASDSVSGNGSSSSSKTASSSSSRISLEEEAALPSSTILVCSSTAKMVASVATYPHEVLRTKLQMQPKTPAAAATMARATDASGNACRTIAREEGIRGFYRGMTVNLVRTVPNSALTILTYELMMRQLTGSSV